MEQINNFIDKLKQSNIWKPFRNWYFEQQVHELGVWPSIDNLEIYNTIFTNLVFIKFIEEYFECYMERMYVNDSGIIYSMVNNTTFEPISFGKYSGFFTLEELILAAFETE